MNVFVNLRVELCHTCLSSKLIGMMKKAAIYTATLMFLYMIVANIYTGHWAYVYNYYFGA